ncbi:DUF2059 domain-containing protein [Massilia genomosp. 1]|uniref:DUF2059 domain-containing protein n=1 Tax=Massilia genomosp. 1 TaxID=2609280 RepID=A0ABX0N0U9_9BURK|nr:DUF2059 domain-containing protein [Massilia genomosp. 1]NHZ66096.1 DUF2059 domain-containing protein [Massilia genomosp. 1]
MREFTAIIVTALALLATPAFAQKAPLDPAVDKAVRSMLDSMNYRKVINDSFAQIQGSLPQMFLQGALSEINSDQRLTPAQKKAAIAKVEKQAPAATQQLRALFEDPTLAEDMIEEMVPLYGSRFTVAEIEQIAAFYGTPVGTKMLAVLPQLTIEAMQLGQRVMLPRIAKIIKANTAIN